MIPNYNPTAYNDAIDVGHINELLEQITERPFLSPQTACDAVRLALTYGGIQLPKLEVERLIEGPNTDEAASYMATGQRLPAPSYDCEYLLKIEDFNPVTFTEHNDNDDGLYFYFVLDRHAELGVYECYAQILDEDEVEDVVMSDIPDELANLDIDLDGKDVNGESPYLKQIRHSGTGGFTSQV